MTAPRYFVEHNNGFVYVALVGAHAVCLCINDENARLIADALNAYNQPQEQEQKQENQ